MKIFSALAVCLAMSPSIRARADVFEDDQTEFVRSLARRLSPAEMAQLDALTKARSQAFVAEQTADGKRRALELASRTAPPADAAALQAKLKAVTATYEAASKRSVATYEAIERFEESKRLPALTLLPDAVRRAMKPGAISLKVERWAVGTQGQPVLIHISVVPRIKPGTLKGAKLPTTSGELFPNQRQFEMLPSPFYVDIFETAMHKVGTRYHLVNSKRFVFDEIITGGLRLAYLKPKTEQGPIITVGYSAFRSGQVRVLTFPSGLRGRMFEQYFPFDFHFDKPDKRGLVAIEQDQGNYYGGLTPREWIIRHTWNGVRFVAGPQKFTPAPFLVVAGISKNRAELESLRASLGGEANALGQSEVVSTREFPLLPRDSYVLVMLRSPRAETAQSRVEWWNESAYMHDSTPAAEKLKLEMKRGF